MPRTLCLAMLPPLVLCGCASAPSPPRRTTATQQRKTQRRVTASPAALQVGLRVFRNNGCGSCHTFLPAGTGGSVAPDLDTKPKDDARRAKMPLADFVRQSTIDPNAYISPGYPKDVMPHGFGRKLSKRQLTDLVAFVTTPP